MENGKKIIKIIEIFNKVTKRNFKADNKATQKLLNARLSEGYSIDDFKIVIEYINDKWCNDTKMKVYIRPSTIFRIDNFENYFQEAILKIREENEEEQW